MSATPLYVTMTGPVYLGVGMNALRLGPLPLWPGTTLTRPAVNRVADVARLGRAGVAGIVGGVVRISRPTSRLDLKMVPQPSLHMHWRHSVVGSEHQLSSKRPVTLGRPKEGFRRRRDLTWWLTAEVL